MSGLDFSGCRKVAQDKKSATFKHKDGHEIRIAISGLSPNMRKRLENLPLHKEDGGDIQSTEPKFNAPAAPEPEAPTQETPEQGGFTDEDSGMPPASSDAPSPEQPTPSIEPPAAKAPAQPQTAPAAEAQAPEAAPAAEAAPIQPAAPTRAAPHLNEQDDKIHDENAKIWHDLTNNHIQAKTYHELLSKDSEGNEKNFFGKIGTVFGLMLAGGASGLTGQPNVLLKMMDQQISNDLEAQKQDVSNKQNLFKLNMENEKNKAAIGETQADTRLANIDADIKATALTKTQMNMFALHDLVLQAQKLPEGSQERAAADKQLAMLSNAVQNENYLIGDRAYAMSALAHATLGGSGGGSGSGTGGGEAQFQAEQRMLRLSGHKDIADDNEARHIPGVSGLASQPLSDADKNQIIQSRSLMESLSRLKEFSKAHPKPIPGSKEDKYGKALAAQVQGDFRMATHGGVYKEGEQNFINQVVPGNPGTWNPFAHVEAKIDAVINETNARNNQFLRMKGFPAQSGSVQRTAGGKKPSNGGSGGKVIVNRQTGEERTLKNGKWVTTKPGKASPGASVGVNDMGPKY